MWLLGPFSPQKIHRNGQIWALGPSFPPQKKTEKWVSVNLRTFLPPKHWDMGHFGLLGLFFLGNTQKWTIWTLGPFFFYPKPLRNGSIWLLGPPFPQKILRNAQMCILGPLFFPQNSQKWVSLGFRASSAPQNTQKWVNFTQKWANSDLRTSFSRKTLRKAQIWALGPLFFSHRNSQKWANGHFMAFFFHPKTPRNGSVWVSGPLPLRRSGMDKCGF